MKWIEAGDREMALVFFTRIHLGEEVRLCGDGTRAARTELQKGGTKIRVLEPDFDGEGEEI